MMKTIAPLLLLAALATPAPAAPPSTTGPTLEQRNVALEITEPAPAGKAATPIRLVVPVVLNASASEIRLRAASSSYHAVVAARRTRADSVVLDLALERHELSGDNPNDYELKVQAMPEAGKRAVLIGADRPDGTRTEVALTLQ